MNDGELNRSTTPLKIAGVVLAVLGLFPLAAVIKWAPVVSWLPVAWKEWVVSMAVVVLLCNLLADRMPAQVDVILGALRRRLMESDQRVFVVAASLFAFIASACVSWRVFGFMPVGGDEVAQNFQARLLLSGRMWGVAEQYPEFVNGVQTPVIDGRWFSQFPIGGSALLAFGGLFGMMWIVNPLLFAWTTASVHGFVTRIADEFTARIATVLFITSPFVLLMSGSQMNHVGALAFTMFALVSLVDWARAAPEETGKLREAALRIGFGFAATAAIRPYDAAVFALVVGIFQLRIARREPAKARSFAWQLVGGVLPLALLFYTNVQQTGDALLFGYDALNSAAHRPGFHVDPSGVDFTPLIGLHHMSSYLLLLNASLFGGPVPALILVIAGLWFATSATRWDHLMLALVGVLVVAYTAYWAESFFMGPRFLYGGVVFFIAIVASIPRGIASRSWSPSRKRAAQLLLPVAFIMTWIQPPGIATWQGGWTAFAGESRANDPASIDVDAAIRDEGLDNALVVVHEGWHGRLAARLRALGAPALQAESMLRELDACGLQVGLDAEDRIGGPPGVERVQHVVRRALAYGPVLRIPNSSGAEMLAFSPTVPIHPLCAQQMQADLGGSVPLDRFLAYARFGRDGKLGGRVVFVRDFGAKNQRLLGRFGDRTWYRYRSRTSVNDQAPVFIPYR